MHDIQAIVLDLDGTLLNSQKQVSARNRAAVLACRAQGIHVILATARPPRSVRMLLPEELLELGWLICYNGALMLHNAQGVTAHHQALPPELVLDIRHHASSSAPDAYVCFEIDDELYSDRQLDRSDATVLGIPPGLPLPEPLTQAQLQGRSVSKLLLPGREGLYDSLQANFGSRLQIVQTDRGQLLQVMAAGVSKASALQKAAEQLHIPIERIMAFGDDFNDLSLFEPGGCGWPVAMGNAIAELHDRARLVTEHHDQDGVAIILEQVLAARIARTQ
jgi:Cof subfamily protein (haloacid dehalogenase superfamily)